MMRIISCSFHHEEVDDSVVFIRALLDKKQRAHLSMDAAIEEIQKAIRLDLKYEDPRLYIPKFSATGQVATAGKNPVRFTERYPMQQWVASLRQSVEIAEAPCETSTPQGQRPLHYDIP